MTQRTAPLPDRCDLSTFQHGFSTHWMDVDRYPADDFVDVLLAAIDVGYRRFDCDPVWDTEPMVGTAIEQSLISREELFITTVVPYDQLGDEGTRTSVASSLDRLGLEYVDAVLASAPMTGWDVDGTASAMNALVEDGIIRHAGARYMCLPDISAFIERLDQPLLAHLTELHPLWPADDLRRHAVEHGYWIIGESPFMQGVVGEIREVRRAAARSAATPYQVTLAWLHQFPNVATSTWAHLPDQQRSNLDADRVDLDQDAIDEISSITRRWSGSPHLHPVE